MTTQTVTFTLEKLARLKTKVAMAIDRGAASFTFDGNKYDVRYASYLVSYLEQKLNTN